MRAPVLERDEELAAVDAALRRARAGAGSVLLAQGPSGIGKSTLLGAAATAAAGQGARVLRATGSEYEREFPFGMVRQLFETLVATADPGRRSVWLDGAARHSELVFGPELLTHPDAGELFATVHGLYWLTANLAGKQPLVLCVDDAQWADEPTRRWLGYTARRLDGLGLVLIVAARSGPGGATLPDELGEPTVLEPAPLSRRAVGRMLAAVTECEPSPAFVHACTHATGGNPLLVTELVRTLADRGVDAGADVATQLPAIVPAAVSRASTARLARLSSDARAVATATAILEPRAEPASIQAVTALGPAAVAAATDELVAAELIGPERPLRFTHPIIAEAVRQGLAPGARSQLHLAAARTFDASRAGVELIGLHLLATDSAGDPWVVDRLLAAAAAAQRIGAHSAAARLLSRALIEPPPPERHGEVAFALGRAQFAAHDPACVAQLEAAMLAAPSPADAAEVAMVLCRALVFAGAAEPAAGLARMTRARLSPGERDLALGLQALELEAAINSGNGPAADALIAALGADQDAWRPDGAGPGARELAAQVGFRHFARGVPTAQVLALAELSLPSADSGDPPVVSPAAAICLVGAEGYGRAEQVLNAVIGRPEAAGLPAAAWAATTLAQLQLNRGELLEAEATARGALRLGNELGPLIATVSTPTLIDTLLELGRTEEARAFDRPPPELIAGLPITVYLLDARGRLALADRRWSDARAAFTAARDVARAGDVSSPAVSRWRTGLARALVAENRRDEAIALAREEVGEARRFGAPGVLGMALREAAAVGPAQERLGGLRQALESLAESERALEHARTEALLGAELRRRGERTAAREHLGAALERALDLGGVAVAELAREELTALGSRRRAQARSGRRALTASELRVARMAAQGMANREIAQSLFVTMKTVEKHLGGAYAKLGVRDRGALAGALGTASDRQE